MRGREERRAALVRKFQEVGAERVQRLAAAWVHLEGQPDDAETAAELLREIHTLKGEARTVGLADLTTLSHRLEEVLFSARDQGFRVPPEVGEGVLYSVDLMASLLRGAAGGTTVDLSAAMALLDAALKLSARSGEADSEIPVQAPPAEPPPQVAPAVAPPAAPRAAPRAAPVPPRPVEVLRVRQERIAAVAEVTGELLVEQARTVFSIERLRARAAELEAVLSEREPQRALQQARALAQAVRHELGGLEEVNARTGLLIDQLEYLGGELRLVPAATILEPYGRMVRELSREQGKEVDLKLEGAQTEADRRVLEAVEEPLVHLLRNAVDHGIELPQVREAAGKPRRGTVRIVLQARGGTLRVTVADDGAGLDAAALRRRAVERGLISPAAAEALDDQRSLELILLAGFSTRDEVSDVSGRGVGMDVVKRRVEQVNGRVSVSGALGVGTRVELTLPIAISRMRALVMRVGDAVCALPSASVEAVVAIDAGEVVNSGEGPLLRFAGALVPLGSLEEVLGETSAPGALRPVAVILRSGGERRAFRAREPGRELELVARPLGPPLEKHRLVTGAAVLPTGELASILDVPQLLARAQKGRGGIGAAQPGARPRRFRVLAVDDSVIIRSTVSDMLRGLGCEVAVAEDGLEGLTQLEAFEPHLVITDIQMPRLDGLGLLRRLRAQPRFRALPVVVLSSLGSATDRAAALDAGATGYLVKSELDDAAMREVLRRHLE